MAGGECPTRDKPSGAVLNIPTLLNETKYSSSQFEQSMSSVFVGISHCLNDLDQYMSNSHSFKHLGLLEQAREEMASAYGLNGHHFEHERRSGLLNVFRGTGKRRKGWTFC